MKRLIKLAIGSAAYAGWRVFAPRRLAATRDKLFASHDLGFIERQVVAFMLAITPPSTQTATDYWAGNAGARFHANSDHRLTVDVVTKDDFYRRPMLDPFVGFARERLGPQATIVEIGCGAGGNLLYLRRMLDGSGFRFVGFDINAAVIASNQSSGDVSFETRNCFTNEVIVPGDLGLISCAVLMYAQESDIKRFLERLSANHSGRILVGLSEPVVDPDAPRSAEHNNLAQTHGYRRIFTQLNFRVLFESTVVESNKSSRIYHAVFELAR